MANEWPQNMQFPIRPRFNAAVPSLRSQPDAQNPEQAPTSQPPRPNIPNERTRTNLMTDEYEFYEPAEAYEKIIHLLRDLPEQLEKCNNYLQGEEEIEEDSEVDDYLVRVTEKMLCVIKALEEAEESDTWAHIRATDIGEDLVGEMDSVEKVILGYNIFGEGGHEVCTQAMVLADIVERLLGRRE